MLKRSPKRPPLQMKYEILSLLSGEQEVTISHIERKTGSRWESIKSHCEELEVFGGIVFIGSNVKITDRGKEYLNTLKKKQQ